ncbi:hypothetical protein AWC38_SpisGene13950 [Stylophora pistillata]|uniref:RNA-directed DNA polymerase from mobile element jockey n=1 Tax=Stylophora pistillata TaxID=50429 RepID=A0A2B4RZ85_STYPI|nr:hypothetical protein AWC38_SpisGene13950 [Stylophora pistillata]
MELKNRSHTGLPFYKSEYPIGHQLLFTKKILHFLQKRAFHDHGPQSNLFKTYRNAVNRKRKNCKAIFYESKVDGMKEKDPKAWWKEVKRLSGALKSSSNLIPLLHIEELEGLPMCETANCVNQALLESLEEYRLPEKIPELTLEDQNPQLLVITVYGVFRCLLNLNAVKAGGPDGIPSWVIKEYAESLAYPVSTILNASFKGQKLPRSWKCADVTPLPKSKPINDIKKDLRPISLTPSISKVAEDFIVTQHLKPAVLSQLDPAKFDVIPKS